MTWRLLACTLLALAGCGEKPEPRVAAEPLVAYEAGNHLHRYGARVFGDGRYELFSTSHPTEPPPWTAYDPFTPEQVDEIAAAVDAALAAGLPDNVPGSDPLPPDSATATFRLRGREIVVAEWPKAGPPELERILDRIQQLRKRPPVPSTWRLWSRGEVVELEARCEIGDVEALSRLRDAIFMAGAPPASGGARADDPPEGTPLVAIDFGQEVLEVYADGRRIDRLGGDDKTRKLDADQMAAIRAALAETDWAALPSRLC